MASKIPLKTMLAAIDRCDTKFYSKLDDDQKKDFSPWLAMRFASAVKGDYADHYLIMVNEFVNHEFTALSKHPELQWQLLSLCGVGANQYHPWIKPPSGKGKNKIQEFLFKLYPESNADDLTLLEMMHSKDDLTDLALQYGMDKKEIKVMLK